MISSLAFSQNDRLNEKPTIGKLDKEKLDLFMSNLHLNESTVYARCVEGVSPSMVIESYYWLAKCHPKLILSNRIKESTQDDQMIDELKDI